MQLIYYPNPILSKPCKSVTDDVISNQTTKDRATLATLMWKIMEDNNGVGLTAPQVGRSIRMFVWRQGGCINNVIWNPILENRISGYTESIEGCLSLPKVNVTVRRAIFLTLSGIGLSGKHVYYMGDAFISRIWQHEIDHLDGKLIIHSMNYENLIANQDAIKELLKKS